MQRCISFIKLRLSMFSEVFIYSVRPLPTFLGHWNLESIFGNDRLCDSWFFFVDYCWKHYLCSYIMRKDKRKHTENSCFLFQKFIFYKSTLVPHISLSSAPFIPPFLFPILSSGSKATFGEPTKSVGKWHCNSMLFDCVGTRERRVNKTTRKS